jgi:hypothetical protein
MDKPLDWLLPPRLQCTLAEAASKTFDPGETYATYLSCITVKQYDPGVSQDLLYFFLFSGLVLMIAEHGNDRDLY